MAITSDASINGSSPRPGKVRRADEDDRDAGCRCLERTGDDLIRSALAAHRVDGDRLHMRRAGSGRGVRR
jgi:hypothetical protein